MMSVLAVGCVMNGAINTAQAAEKSITIAQAIDLSGPNGSIGRDYVAGLTSYFDSVNASGGVNGKKIRFIVRDDHGEANLAAQYTKDLIEQEKPRYLLGGIGVETTSAVLSMPSFTKSGLTLFAPLTDSTAAHGNRAVVWRPNKEQEIQYIFSYFGKLGLKKIGIAIGDAPGNRQLQDYMVNEVKKRGLSLAAMVPIGSHSATNAQQIRTLAEAKPDIVICLLDTINTALFLKPFHKLSPSTPVAGTSLINLVTLSEIVGPKAMEWTVFSQVVPNPNTSNTPLQLEHQKAMHRFRDETASAMTLEGFAVAKTLVHAMSNDIELADLKRNAIDLGGLNLVRIDGVTNLSQFVDIALFRRGGTLLY
jgi:ABC-type branched-subunit amino acid transport system substrate-binding protein